MRNRLIQLLADNRQCPARRFEVKANAAGTEVEILLYDAIVDSELEAEWWGGVAPEPFVKAVRAITADTIHLRINSPGGSVFAARAMETALREHKARVVVHIDALAASAASFLAMAGDEIVISKGAMIMIHKAWTWAWGNSDELSKTADLLAKIDGTLVETYADRTKRDAAEINSWMTAETWFTAQEAVEHGFADRIADTGAAEPGASAAWNLRAYLRAPGPENVPTPGAEPKTEPSADAPSAPQAPAAPTPPTGQVDASTARTRQQQRLRAALLTEPIA